MPGLYALRIRFGRSLNLMCKVCFWKNYMLFNIVQFDAWDVIITSPNVIL